MLKSLVFAETSPASAATAASSAAVTGSSGAAGVAALATDLSSFVALQVIAEIGSPVRGTLDVYLQTSFDGGSTWYDYAHFPQRAAAAAAIKYAFSVTRDAQVTTPLAIGKSTTPVLAANVVLGGPWGDSFRLLMVGGTSTSAGATVGVTIAAVKS